MANRLGESGVIRATFWPQAEDRPKMESRNNDDHERLEHDMSRFAWARVLGIAGTLVVVIGCSSPPAAPATQPRPTLPSAPPATTVATTPGATDVQLVNGSIDNVAGHML